MHSSSNILPSHSCSYQYHAVNCAAWHHRERRHIINLSHHDMKMCYVMNTAAVEFLKQRTHKFEQPIRRQGPSHQYARVVYSKTTIIVPTRPGSAWYVVEGRLCGYISLGGVPKVHSVEAGTEFQPIWADYGGIPRNCRNSGRNKHPRSLVHYEFTIQSAVNFSP